MRTLLALTLILFGLSACGSGAGATAPLTQSQVCHQWAHIEAHPGDDPLDATSNLLQRARPGSRVGEALLRLNQDMIHNTTHARRRPLDADLARLDRICS